MSDAMRIRFREMIVMLVVTFLGALCMKTIRGDDIFKPTGRYAQTKQTQWYLVSETWCINCPPAKARFLAKGWPAANVITIAEAQSRFGKSVPFVPFEFPEPEPKSEGTIQPAAQVVTQTQQYRRFVPQRRGLFRWRR